MNTIRLEHEGADGFDLLGELVTHVIMVNGPELLADLVADDAINRLESGDSDPDGQVWKPWSPAYAATRNSSHKLLFDSGDLAKGLQVRRSGNGVYDVVSDQPYAKFNQLTRPFVGVGGHIETEFGITLQHGLDERWGPLG